MANWYKIDGIAYPFPAHVHPTEDCRFARDYQGGATGYSAGVTNSLILNFKKDVAKRNRPEWTYRQGAVDSFARELCDIFQPGSVATVTNIPTSKPRSSADYDQRFEDMFARLKTYRPNLNIIYPLDVIAQQQPTHLGGSRNPTTLQANLVFRGFSQSPPQHLILIDDVITQGAHFRACVDCLRQNNFNGQIIGLFWARTI